MKSLAGVLFLVILEVGIAAQANADMTGGLRGTVVDWFGPWAGAEVRVIAPERFIIATTNARGEFAILGLQPGISTVEVWSTGYPTITANVFVCEDTTRSLHFVLVHSPPEPKGCDDGGDCYTIQEPMRPPPLITSLLC